MRVRGRKQLDVAKKEVGRRRAWREGPAPPPPYLLSCPLALNRNLQSAFCLAEMGRICSYSLTE